MSDTQRRRVYVASSWRNPDQPLVVGAIRDAGHDVYDFRNPRPGDKGFHWSEIDLGWERWAADEYIDALEHPKAQVGYASDMSAMQWADTVVLVQPCGRSAHLELGWAVGAQKETFVLLEERIEPELMLRMVDRICPDLPSLIEALAATPKKGNGQR